MLLLSCMVLATAEKISGFHWDFLRLIHHLPCMELNNS
jgi:hypothetical protein